MNFLLRSVVEHLVRQGDLTIIDPQGAAHTFGDGTGPKSTIAIRTRAAERAIMLDLMLAVPEAYMEGELDVLEGDLLDLLRIAFRNMGTSGIEASWARAVKGVRTAFRRLQQVNTAGRSKRNVARHYDLSPELYRLFLDGDMQYSCAYFEHPDASLEEAQLAKKRHIAAKLDLRPGQTVLDIGCGFGGLGLYLARNFDVDVVGVTLSEEQHSIATERAHAEGLDRHVHFELRDYRDLSERFDRVVSVGMFEHVGLNHYRTFFDKAATLLKPDGVMLLHSIGQFGVPAATNPFIRKHIFPGGYIPALSDVFPAVERAQLMTTDVEILRLHYAETLKHWRQRFQTNRETIRGIYDERFCRMWEFYLAGSEAAFRWQDLMVFQIQLTRANSVLPTTRDYIRATESEYRERERAEPGHPREAQSNQSMSEPRK